MKKLFSFSVVLLFATLTCTSCLDDNDNHAEAEISYAGAVDSIHFTDQADTAYHQLIYEALYSEKLKVAGNASVFTEKAKVNSGSMIMAVAVCDSMASEDYVKLLRNVSLSDVRGTIFYAHEDSLRHLGVNGPELVPISPFTAYISLYSSHQGKTVNRFNPSFR